MCLCTLVKVPTLKVHTPTTPTPNYPPTPPAIRQHTVYTAVWPGGERGGEGGWGSGRGGGGVCPFTVHTPTTHTLCAPGMCFASAFSNRSSHFENETHFSPIRMSRLRQFESAAHRSNPSACHPVCR
jgi:hypothetical protein